MLRGRRGLLLVPIVLATALAGCGSGGGGTTASGSAATPRARPEQPAPAPGKKSARRRDPIETGEVRSIPGSSGEGAWAPGRAIYLTANGGRTWRGAAPVDVHGFFGSDFVDPEHGWIAAATSSRNPALEIYTTADGGFTWTRATVRKSRQLSIAGVGFSFPSLRVGYALVGPQHGSGVEPGASLYRTEDGGADWSPIESTPVEGSIDFTSPRRGWLGDGPTGSLWHTDDGGRHWTRVRVAPAPRGARHLRYGVPTRLAGGLEVLPVLLEGSPTRIAFYERSPSDWKLAYVDTLVGSIGGGLDGTVVDRPPDGFVVLDPGAHALRLVRFGPGGGVSTRILPARGLPSGASIHFGDARHGFARPCSDCEHPGTQPYFTDDGGRTWVRRPIRIRRSAALEALPRCSPAKLLVYHREEGGAGLGSIYTALTIENLSGHTCKYSGTPRAVAVRVGGRKVGGEARPGTYRRPSPGHRHRTVILLPDGTARAQLSYGQAYNYPQRACRIVTAAGLLVTLPGARRPQRVAMPFLRCSNPHVYGSGAGMIIGRIE